MAEDIVPMKELNIKTVQSGEYENRTFRFADLKEDRYIIARIVSYKTGEKVKKQFFTPEEMKRIEEAKAKGETVEIKEPWNLYVLDITQPAVGIVSVFVKKHEHYGLKNYNVDEVVQIIGVKRKTTKGTPYASIEVKKLELKMTDDDIKKAVEGIRAVEVELGTNQDEIGIREILADMGFTKDEDIKKILAALVQSRKAE